MRIYSFFLLYLCIMAISVSALDDCWIPHQPGSYTTGSQVSRLNRNYRANWTTIETPGAENWGGWTDCGECDNGSGNISTNACWDSYVGGYYRMGSEVSYLGYNYRANWGTAETPGVENWGGWENMGECEECNESAPTNILLSNSFIKEGAGDNAIIGYLSAEDAEGGKMYFRFVNGVGDVDNDAFIIQGNILRAKESFKHFVQSSYFIRIEVLDPEGNTFNKSFVITVVKSDKPDGIIIIDYIPTTISEFALYSHNEMNITSEVTVTGGAIGTNSSLKLGDDLSAGWAADLKGDLWANGDIKTLSEATITGDVYAGGTINLGYSATISGDSASNHKVPYFIIPRKSVPTSQENISIPWKEELRLEPGTYGTLSAGSESKLILTGGVYNFTNFELSSNKITLEIDLDAGETIEINADKKITFGSELQMVFTNNVAPMAVNIYTNQYDPLILSDHSTFYGVITAPKATVNINAGTKVYGSIYADKINAVWKSYICKPPYLTDIWHSEWAYAKPFDPNLITYKAITPEGLRKLHTKATASQKEFKVSINGKSADEEIDITHDLQDIVIAVSGGECNLTTKYYLTIDQSVDYVIYVNSAQRDNSHTGTSWNYAYNNLQDAINDAEKSGKEIWVAEGTYKPTLLINNKDPRSKTFLLKQGIEIIGGFVGTERTNDPKGSPYKTILSGDISNNDHNLSQWPPKTEELSLLKDNAYHVVTIDGSVAAQSTRLKGVTIQGGVATGIVNESRGAGIFSNYAYPAIEECIIKQNYAASHGAGIFAGSGLQNFAKALFDENISASGHGAGLYINNSRPVTIEQTAFYNNQSLGMDGNPAGGAIFAHESEMNFTNTLFCANRAKSDGGAIFANNSVITINYTTLTQNESENGCDGIRNNNGSVTISNSVLWHPSTGNSSEDLSGNQITVTYSDVAKAVSGTGNISLEPKFVNKNSAKGEDGVFGTLDDGLRITGNSPLIGISSEEYPEFDIIEMYRSGDRSDIGAYIYIPPMPEGSEFLGIKYNGNKFKQTPDIYVYKPFRNEWRKQLAINSPNARYIRVLVPKNKHTKNVNSFYVELTVQDENGNSIAGINTRRIYMEKDGSADGQHAFFSIKPIIFINDERYVNKLGDNNDAYFIYGSKNTTNFHLFSPGSQF